MMVNVCVVSVCSGKTLVTDWLTSNLENAIKCKTCELLTGGAELYLLYLHDELSWIHNKCQK